MGHADRECYVRSGPVQSYWVEIPQTVVHVVGAKVGAPEFRTGGGALHGGYVYSGLRIKYVATSEGNGDVGTEMQVIRPVFLHAAHEESFQLRVHRSVPKVGVLDLALVEVHLQAEEAIGLVLHRLRPAREAAHSEGEDPGFLSLPSACLQGRDENLNRLH